MRRHLIALTMAGLLAIPGIVHAAQLPATWSNLVQVSSQNFRTAYLLPGADFRAYNKIMLDPTEVDFVDNWVWKMNTSYSFAKGRTSDRDANTIAAAVRDGFQQRWSDAFTKAGWTVVTQPGPDVLRVRTIVFNLAISAPYTVTQSQGSVRSVDAGQASLLVEARDSESGAVLGSILDARRAGENKAYMPRSRVSNKADFGRLFNDWADASIRGLAQLKALSPVDANARAIKTSE